jgi:hypothetical protein
MTNRALPFVAAAVAALYAVVAAVAFGPVRTAVASLIGALV